MHEHRTLPQAAFAALALAAALGTGAAWADEAKPMVRELFVPFEELDVLLADQPQRVLLSRKEYADLLAKAEVAPETRAPRAAVILAADYRATAEAERARLTGTLSIEVLEKGLHAVDLDLSGVGLRRATLDGKNAPIGRAEGGPLKLFVEGKGRHELVLEMVTPLETTAATQVLNVRLPRPPAATLNLTVPGDVEVKSGADVARRAVDEAAGVTRLELLPQEGDLTLVMTLNSRLMRRRRAVMARSVVVAEVTEAYERLHATVSARVLHQAVEDLQLVVPEGFEVTEVSSPVLARWAVEAQEGRRVLEVRLREPTTETVTLVISAVRTGGSLDAWTFPRLEPLDVVGHVAVVGLLSSDRLTAQSIAAEGLIPIDTSVIREAIPATVREAEPGAPPLRPVVAYYAPQSEFSLSARFARPPAEISVMTNVLLLLREQDQQARGEFFLASKVEKLFGFDFSVPPAWDVTAVTTPDGAPLAFERYGEDDARRIRVRLPQGVPPGEECRVYFNARSTPAGWLGSWESTEVRFPRFAVAGAAEDVGAIAVEAPEGEMHLRLAAHENLVPLDAAERAQYGLEAAETGGRVLAYRYDTQPYSATVSVRRTEPRLTAKTFSFLRVEADAIDVHYELVYQVEEARARELSLLLPKSTPADLSIEALDGAGLKQSTSAPAGEMRRWTALLEEPRIGAIRLAVDFRQPLPEKEARDQQELRGFALPVVRADGVAHQSGLVAVEGHSELEVQVATDARRVDVGELAEARRRPGRGLLGVFGYVGAPPEVKVDVFRRPGYRLHPTIVERAELTTRLSAAGASVHVARFALRTKAVYLEIELPARASLWSADLDDKPLKPQREGDHLLVSLPAASGEKPRVLRIVYETPVDAIRMTGRLAIAPPVLRLRADRQTRGIEVPMADLVWHLHAPPGYQVVGSDGTLTADLERPEPAILTVARGLGAVMFLPNPLFLLSTQRRGADMAAIPTTEAPVGLDQQAELEVGGQTLPSPEYMGDDVQYFEPSADFQMAKERTALKAEREAEPAAQAEQTAQAADAAMAGEKPTTGPRGPEAAEEKPAEAPPPEAPVPAPPAVERFIEEADALRRSDEEQASRIDGDAQVSAGVQLEGQQAELAEKSVPALGRLKGFRGLKIDLENAPSAAGAVTFRSLGVKPRLVVRLAHRPRFDLLAWAIGLAVVLAGFALTGRPVRSKFRFVVLVVLVGTLVPLVPGWEASIGPANAAVFAAFLLVPYYLLAGCVRWFAGLVARRPKGRAAAAVAAAIAVGVAVASDTAQADEAPKSHPEEDPYVVQIVEPPEPVAVPDDAILLPYDPESEEGVAGAEQLLVPYAKYVELWNLAYPDQKIQDGEPPAAYALAGASYTATLEGDEYLLVEGRLEIDVHTDEPAAVPLGLSGGVLARAELDGRPARLSVPQVDQPHPQPASQPQQQRPAPPSPPSAPQAANAPAQSQREAQSASEPGRPLLVLHVSGKGRHTFEVGVRLRLDRRGGWRVAEGALPSAPAASLAVTVPQAETDVRLGRVVDRPSYETERPGQTIETALSPDGAVSLQWRPKVAEGQVDRSLTVRSTALLDVQEDGLRLAWQFALEFRRSQREVFTVHAPADYLVERVEGTNVRGWEVREEAGHQAIEVTLLKAARDGEQFAVHLWRRGPVGRGELTEFAAPVLTVPDAALHTGRLAIRRSPLLELRTRARSGLTRTDPSNDAPADGRAEAVKSPLEIRPYEAYQFAAAPFTLRLKAAPSAGRVTAEVQTVLKLAEFERSLESQVDVESKDRPIHRVELFLPDELELDDVSAPGEFHWALTHRDDRPLLTVYLGAGRQGRVPIRVDGTLARQAATDPLPLPRLEVLGVDRQRGEIAVQVDPAFDVDLVRREHCEEVRPGAIHDWLNPAHVDVTALALRYDRPDYRGTIRVSLRQPVVTCETITNVRVTDRAIEETVLLNFTIEEAGIRAVEFLLPRRMRASRIQVPMLRQKTVEPAGEDDDAPVRVRLELQDDVMGDLRVLVENDRELTGEPQSAPIPAVRTGRTMRQAVALQSAGRDEVVVDRGRLAGLKPLRRSEGRWEELRELLGGLTEAYLVAADAEEPRLAFQTRRREAVETTGSRIGLAETRLVVDAAGAYRAEQVYRLDNATEQFLVVELPAGARLWTATVAGEPAKPTEVPGAKNPSLLRIPLVKTAPGDLDYAVVLKYGGKMPAMGSLGAAGTPVRFPLLHTENIRVELSQVRLYLPEDYRWFDFGGTMSPAKREQELKDGRASYQTKMAERLLDVMQHANPYAKRRAAKNLLRLDAAMENYHSTARSFPGYMEYTGDSEVLEKAQQQLEQFEQGAGEMAAPDNRFRLNTLFDEQETARARNVVQDLGSNWSRPLDEKDPQGAQSSAQFDRDWLEGNRLISESADKKQNANGRLPSKSKAAGKSRLAEPKKAPAPAQQRFRGTRFQEGKGAPPSKPSRGRGEAQRDRSGARSDRYGDYGLEGKLHRGVGRQSGREREARPSEGLPEVVTGGRRFAVPSDAPVPAGRVEASVESGKPVSVKDGAAVAFSPDGDMLATRSEDGVVTYRDSSVVPQFGGLPSAPATPADLPAGLASLDVELPLRGVVYRFTTPGGDAEITARALPSRLLRRVGGAAALVVAVLLLLWLVRVGRRGVSAGWPAARPRRA